jgi:hypothetical protein
LGFVVSRLFTNSNEFSRSDEFDGTASLDFASIFTQSLASSHSPSLLLTSKDVRSLDVTTSHDFSSSDFFSTTRLFKFPSFFTQSSTFAPSDWCIPTHMFVGSHNFTNSDRFAHSNPSSETRSLDVTSSSLNARPSQLLYRSIGYSDFLFLLISPIQMNFPTPMNVVEPSRKIDV